MTVDTTSAAMDARVIYDKEQRSITLVVDSNAGYVAITFRDNGIFYYNSNDGNITNWGK